jgi:hypothetical protein
VESDQIRARIAATEADSLAEVVLREELLRTLATLDQLRADVRKRGVVIRGARGAEQTNPSVASAARLTGVVQGLCARLWPPAETRGQRQGRRAAEARWHR